MYLKIGDFPTPKRKFKCPVLQSRVHPFPIFFHTACNSVTFSVPEPVSADKQEIQVQVNRRRIEGVTKLTVSFDYLKNNFSEIMEMEVMTPLNLSLSGNRKAFKGCSELRSRTNKKGTTQW